MSELSNSEKIRYVLSRVRRVLCHCLMYACRIVPIQKNKVVIINYYGKGFGDNGKAIAIMLHEQDPGLEIVWPTTENNGASLPDFCRNVKFRSIRYYYEMATAAVWIDNSRKGADIVKRKKQYYIQTWHGMVAMKQIEKDAQESLSIGYIDDAKNDSKMADVILSGCGFFTKLCRRAFWFDSEILECGSPRLDVLFEQSQERRNMVRRQLNISDGKKVLLYAPTFRANGNTDCYIQNFEQILDVLNEQTGEEWVAAVRLHPNVANKAGVVAYSDRVINTTVYPDLYELIPVADIVVSDYSSVMFDAGLINKKVLLYATDIEAYIADRNFYFNIENLPFPLAHNSRELIDKLVNFDQKTYQQKLDEFNGSLEYYENGTASKTVADRIMKVLGK